MIRQFNRIGLIKKIKSAPSINGEDALKKIQLTNEQYAAIKHLISDLSAGAESIFENEYDSIEEESPGLYHALLEFHELWESNKTRESLEIWVEEIDN